MHEDALKVVLRLAMRERTPSRAARTAAVHEAGHALAMHAAGVLPDEIRMGGGTGPDSAVTYAPFDWHAGVLTAGRGRRWLRVMMAGRAAESLEFGAVSSGCESDLDAARALAKGMLSAWALEPWPEAARASVGSRAASGGNAPAKRGRPRERDAVEMLLHRAEDEAGDLLKQRRQTLRLLARELLARPVIYRADLARMLGEPPVVDGADPYGLGGPE
jgi:ATP-dependent Zn protease